MKYAVLATWKMALEGTKKAASLLAAGEHSGKAIVEGVCMVEDEPSFHSVGYGGRPNAEGRVFLDGGYMDGDSLHFGAVGSIENFRSPVRIAYSLKEGEANNFLVGEGAERYAEEHGFERRNNLTAEAEQLYLEEKDKIKELSAYDGHDTVCFLALDQNGTLCAATSTSGLFMKKPGRLGDTPLPGVGYYADSAYGAAAATGMGEEIMKGALSYAAVQYLRQGRTAREAAETAVNELDAELRRRNGQAAAMSLIVLAKDGTYGIGTNVSFTYCFASESEDAAVHEITV